MYGHRLLRELFGLFFLFLGLLMLISLKSYDIGDPTFNQAVSITASSIQNSAGLFGAYLAGFLVDSFGVASFLWVLFFLAIGAGLISRWLVIKWYRWIGYLLLYLCALVFSSAAGISICGIHGGGLAGEWLCALSYLAFSPLGSMLLWIFVFLMAMELSFSIPWLTLAGRFLSWLAGHIRSFSESSDAPNALPGWKMKKISLPSFPLKGLLEKLKRKKEDIPRPILDILSDRNRNEGASPEPAAQDESLTLSLDDSPGDTALKPAEENASASGDSELLSLSSEPFSAAASVVEENPEEKNDGFIFELEDIVGQEVPADQRNPEVFSDAAVSAEGASPGRQDDAATLAEDVREERGAEETFSPDSSRRADEPSLSHAGDMQPAPAGLQESASSSSGGDDSSPISSPAQESGGNSGQGEAQERRPDASESQGLPQRLGSSSSPYPYARVIKLPEKQGQDSAHSEPSAGAASSPARPSLEPTSQAGAQSGRKNRILPLPSLNLLDPLPASALLERPDNAVLARQGEAVITCLKNFNVQASLAKITPGPVITMFEVRPAPGVKATRITNLADDLAMSLKATAVRMQAPVPGTDTVGVEVPNQKRATVYFREIVEDQAFRGAGSLLTVALGKDTGGHPVSADLARMPHLLVAGATGQGKSVCLNAILLSLLCRARPDEVQLILVDPKRVEFSMYADLPHLVHPVVTDMDLTKNALLWAIDEMNRRLSLFSKVQVRNITGYNERQAKLRRDVETGGPIPVDGEGEPEDLSNMPFLVIVVDELADLMMLKRKEVEGSIVRLAQLARAAGIHLIIATQRPSVDVVTGLIKANFPCRIAFKVTSSQDSRTILDGIGAEKLLGMGDMLFKSNTGAVKRIHGAFVSDSEVAALVEYWKKLQKPNYKVDFSEFGSDESEEAADDFGQASSRNNEIVDDPVYAEAIQFVLENGKVSISLLQRRFRIGFNRAARFVEQMERDGLLGEADGSKPRVVRR